jgi:1,4-dihydroxy-2-naphthoyl-CoA hydrolase
MTADLHALAGLMPFTDGMGMTLQKAAADEVVATMPWAPHLCTAGGILHGGALMSLADSAGALVAFLGLDDGQTTATITSTTQMFRPVTGGTVRATAVPVHRGRTTVTIQTRLHDDRDRLVAQTTQVQAVQAAR